MKGFFLILCLFFGSSFGHSMMQCVKYDAVNDVCLAPIRSAGESLNSESYKWTSAKPLCNTPMTNPISDSYSNGPGCQAWIGCPLPMGTFNPGETFTLYWYARGHAIDNQTPKIIQVFMSPPEDMDQGEDVTSTVIMQNEICRGPYMNCGGQNDATTKCTLQCTIPANTVPAIYTLWWRWDWKSAVGEDYATCADIIVQGGSPAQTTNARVTTKALTSNLLTTKRLTTQANISQPITSQKMTTGTSNIPSSSSASSLSSLNLPTSASATSATSASSTSASATSASATSGSATSAPVTSVSTTLNPSEMCYKPGKAVNQYGPINNPPTCGILASNARCYDNQCCSEKGYCGPTVAADGKYYAEVGGINQPVSESYAFGLFCNDKSSADYRKVPCSEVSSAKSLEWNVLIFFALLFVALL